jgi:phospholipid/cholesterol/gamma-HCH transport system ATP-binding protein
MDNNQQDNIAIEVIDLKKSFGKQTVLKGVNLKIKKGESLVVIGKSGGGKSVFMKHIIGLLKPDSGKILMNGEDITFYKGKKLNGFRKKCAYLFQGGALFDSMTVIENIMFPLVEKTAMDKKTIHKKARDIIAQVGLKDMDEKYPAQLSGGMQKRVALARALVIEPEILLFDEPTTGLDPIIMNSILNLMKQTHERFKYTGITISHEVPTIFSVADRVAMLHEGQIVAIDTPDKITKSASPVVAAFIGEACQFRASAAVSDHLAPYDEEPIDAIQM